jgi:hypothetical protein
VIAWERYMREVEGVGSSTIRLVVALQAPGAPWPRAAQPDRRGRTAGDQLR